jgi:PucR family transcriptional regulator, purine catabolism regulatory protein
VGAPPRSRLSLGDLLAEGAYGLRLLSGDTTVAATRPVAGAHVVEVDAPTRFLEPEWVMLTSGVRLRGRSDAQRDLVRELDGAGVTALGFGEGVVFKRVPSALLDAAAERDFPIFAVPFATPFREVVHYIESSLASDEVGVFRRLTALQRYLVDALRGKEPERVMAERLARFLDTDVIVAGAGGEPEIVVGHPPADELCADLAGRTAGPVDLEAPGCEALAVPIAAPGDTDAPTRWLVLAGRRPGRLDRLVKPAAEAVAPLLAALGRLGDVAREQEQAVRGALLEEALAPAPEADRSAMSARVAAFGVDFSSPARIVVIRYARTEDGTADLARAVRTLAGRLEEAGAPHLVTQREAAIAALVQAGDDELASAVDAIAGSRPGIVVGVGRPVGSIAEVGHSLRDAELAADRAGATGKQVLRFEAFDLGTFMVSEIGAERLRPKLDAPLAVLHDNPPLHEALTAWFEHDLDIVATAKALHLHPNSLRYRLSRIEQLLDRSLRSPATIAELHIALVADGGS